MGNLTKNFNNSEFECKCGKCECKINVVLVQMLQKARDLICKEIGKDYPIKILSGCRCIEHNKHEYGSPTSSHINGLAADIALDSYHKQIVLNAFREVGFKRIGIGNHMVHVDVDNSKPDAVWFYKNK